jgi:hypothetical protein
MSAIALQLPSVPQANPQLFRTAAHCQTPQQVMEEEERDNKLDVLDIIAVKAKQGVGIAVDLAALAGIEQQIDNADASGDGNLDLAELQKLMGDVDLSVAFPGKVSSNQKWSLGWCDV